MNDFEFIPVGKAEGDDEEPVTALSFSNNAGDVEEPLFKEKNRGFSFLSFAATLADDKKIVELNTKREERELKFDANFITWNNQTKFLANNSFNNDFFNEIVNMGEDAVPMIYAELKKGPTPLVHALDLIYPGEVEYEGYVPLDAVCMLWEDILKLKGKV